MPQSTLIRLGSEVWHLGFQVPGELYNSFKSQGIKRLMCTINDTLTFHTAIYSSKNDGYFITVNRQQIQQLGLSEGQTIHFQLAEDTSKYGIYLPPEMEELLEQDKEGGQVFHELTPGKQRTLLHMVGKIKSPDIRIKRAITILEYLKSVNGQLDFKELNEAIKASNRSVG